MACVCKGICIKYKFSKIGLKGGYYENGAKKCQTCGGIYIKCDKWYCPCCGGHLRRIPRDKHPHKKEHNWIPLPNI